MKNTRQKLVSVLETAIGIALGLCLFAGGAGFIGFVVAFILGGETAPLICVWLSKTYYPILIKLSTITTLCCFLLNYLNGSAKWVNPLDRLKKKG